MSTTPFPTPNSTPIDQIFVNGIPRLSIRSDSKAVRRRPTMSQGQALEMIGHAIEYVYDSRVYQNAGALSKSDMEAVQTLMRLSREVYLECKEIAPDSDRHGIKHWLLNLLSGKHAA